MNAPSPNALPPSSPSPGRAWLLAVLAAALTFAGLAPSLRWSQFTSGNENIVVATALEMRQGGPWLLPQLMGEPRVKKPPLVAWITAAAMRPATVDALRDPAKRDAAYVDLAWQSRWAGLAAGCVFVLAAFEFARVALGETAAVFAALAAATNFLVLKYARQSTTDTHLAAWVMIANAAFVHGLLRGRWAVAGVVGGSATGLAFLCKGPVALAETALPLVVAVAVVRPAFGRRAVVWTAVGTLLGAAVALPWFVYVARHVDDVWHVWFSEVTREGATDLQPGTPLMYAVLPFETVPWVVFGFVGVLALWTRRRDRRAWVAAIFALVPFLAMVWVRDRKERYGLPMVGPLCAACGLGTAVWVDHWRRRGGGAWAVLAVHGVLVVGIGVGLFVEGTRLKAADGRPWWTAGLAAWGVVAVLALAGLTAVVQRRWAAAVPWATFVATLSVWAALQFGYSQATPGRSAFKPMADAILARAPHAEVYDWVAPPHRADEQLAIYLGHTVHRADPATLAPGVDPIVVVYRQGSHDGPPTPPAEYGLLSRIDDGPIQWFAFVRYPGR